MPNDPSLEPASKITVTAWFKGGAQAPFVYLVSKGGQDCQAASYGLYTGPDKGLVFYVSQNQALSYTRSPDAGTGVWDNNWHFAVGTYDGNSVRLYVDGKQIGNGTPLSGPIGYGLLDNNDLFFGSYPTCGGEKLRRFDRRAHRVEPSVQSVRGADRQLAARRPASFLRAPDLLAWKLSVRKR